MQALPDAQTASNPASSSTGESEVPQDGSSSSGVGFLPPPDVGDTAFACDIWTHDCPTGEKCMPWANDGGGAWNATRCSPIAAKPASIGEPCHVDGSGVSGLDDCELASMCWDVDPETNEGTCVPLCVGHPAFPLCEDPTRACRQAAGGVLNLCLETCHPVLQNCPEGRRCTYDWNAFYCEPDLSHGGGTLNSPCYAGTCAPGYECMAAPPNLCSGSEACCRPFCEVGTLGPPCAATEECVPWFGDGKAPARLEDVGYCAFPEL